MAEPHGRGWILAAGCALLAGCSLLVGDLKECQTAGDCADGRVCTEGFCLPQTIPAGCQGNPDAGVLAAYGRPDAGDAIWFGAVLSLTDAQGAPSDIDLQELNGLRLALEEIDDRGVGGRRLALQVCDYASQPERVPAMTQWLVDEVGVPAVIVSNSSGVLLAAPVTQRGVVLMSPNATSTELTALDAPDGGVRLVWRTAPSDAIQGEVINELLLGTGSHDAGLAEVERVGIAYVDDPYGQGLNFILQSGLNGQKTVEAAQYPRGGNLGNAVSALADFGPELTVVVGFPDDAIRLVNAAAAEPNLSRASGHRWFFTDASKDPSVVASTAGEVEGSFGTAPAKGAGPAYQVFASRFSASFDVDPDSYAFVEHDYDAMYVLALGAAYAVGADGTGELTGPRLAEGLTRLSAGTEVTVGPSGFTTAKSVLESGGTVDLEGASGELQFDPATGEAPGPIELWQVDGGTIVDVARITPQ